MQNIFIVHCERISKRSYYYVSYEPNDQLSGRIKELPEDMRKWNNPQKMWEISTLGLLRIIKLYRGSTKIRFDFGSEEARNLFAKQIQKIEAAEAEREKKLRELKENKENWLNYKVELEKNYEQYSELAHSFLKDGIKLFPHQIVAGLFLNRAKSALISHEMGTGKSLSSILYCEMNNYEKIIVITPNSLKFNYFNEVDKFTDSKAYIINKRKNKYTIEESKYIIFNYEYFNPSNKIKFSNKWKKLGIGNINALVFDECFTYDTLIETTRGKLKIGDIVEKKIPVKVLTYNHTLKKTEYKSISGYLYNGEKSVMKINLSNGKSIECTPNHKIYINNDYIEAKNLKNGDKLFILQKGIQKEKKFTNVLFNELCSTIFKCFWKTKNNCREIVSDINCKWKHDRTCIEKLSDLWERISSSKQKNKKILLNKLFCKMENITTRIYKKFVYKRNFTKQFNKNVELLQKKSRTKSDYFGTNENKQPYVQTREYRQDGFKNKRKNIFISWWKWKINEATNIIVSSNKWINSNGNGILNTCYNTIKRIKNRSTVTTNTLLCGHWYTFDKTGYRNRWKITQEKIMEIFRQKENRNIEYAWVESIEILESGNRQRFGKGNIDYKRTYNIEVEDNHNYFAENILVSNCQSLKNTSTNTYKNIKALFIDDIFVDNLVSRVFLSGTPAPNRAHELYSVLNLISPLDFPTKKFFNEYYCGMTYDLYNGWGWVNGSAESKLEELYHKIAPFTHRVLKKNVLKDLPDKTYQRLIMEMDDVDQKIYEETEKGVVNDFLQDPTSNPLTIMLRLRQYTSHLKSKQVQEIIDTILETGDKIVVVDVFKESLIELKRIYGDLACLHTGDYTPEQRAEMVNDFQNPNGKCKVFLGSIQTCNYGLTLTAASRMIILTLPFSVGQYDQVSDRIHRIGQKDAVNIYVPIFEETIDDYVYSTIESKRKEITKVMDNVDYEADITESVARDVINLIKNKYK